MKVCEFMDLCYDKGLCEVKIYDTTSEEVIFKGNGDEIPESIEDKEVESFDVPVEAFCITLNVE